MAIVADIDDLAAAEFLLMLSQNRKSGKLSGVNGQDRILVAFRNGSIVYAASTSARERIGSILVGRKLVSEEHLQAAIKTQQQAVGVKHLGTILVDMGVITHEALAEVVQDQFQKVVAELLSWEEGLLSFTSLDIPDLGAVHVDPREILLDMGFETEQIVIGSMSELEDSQREREVAEAQRQAEMGEHISNEAQELMRSMMQEMQNMSTSITAEISVQLLTRAMEVVNRAVLMMAFPTHFGGVGGFGFDREGVSSQEVCRKFVIPRSHGSFLTTIVDHGETYRGPLEDTTTNRYILEQLGDVFPTQIIVIPLRVKGNVWALLYGDNGETQTPLDTSDSLEAAVAQAAASLTQAHESPG